MKNELLVKTELNKNKLSESVMMNQFILRSSGKGIYLFLTSYKYLLLLEINTTVEIII